MVCVHHARDFGHLSNVFSIIFTLNLKTFTPLFYTNPHTLHDIGPHTSMLETRTKSYQFCKPSSNPYYHHITIIIVSEVHGHLGCSLVTIIIFLLLFYHMLFYPILLINECYFILSQSNTFIS